MIYMKSIKLMADYQCFPLWWYNSDIVGDINPEDLPISNELKDGLLKWSDLYDSFINLEEPNVDKDIPQETMDNFENTGLELWKKLQQELEGKYRVVYFSNKTLKILK